MRARQRRSLAHSNDRGHRRRGYRIHQSFAPSKSHCKVSSITFQAMMHSRSIRAKTTSQALCGWRHQHQWQHHPDPYRQFPTFPFLANRAAHKATAHKMRIAGRQRPQYVPVHARRCVGINGGSGSPDVYGAVWARDYNRSNSNNAEIVVPDDMGSLIWQNFGSGFDLGIREYAALGTTDWSLVQAPSP